MSDMEENSNITLIIKEEIQATFHFAGDVRSFYNPISTTLRKHPQMWFSAKVQNDLEKEIYLKGDPEGIHPDSIDFLKHFCEKQDKYIQIAIQGLLAFSNLDWNTDTFTTTSEDWKLLSVLYYGERMTYDFGLAFYPNNQKWIDEYCQWFVTFFNATMVGINRVQW